MRTVPEWIGKTDDAVPPPRVRVRVYDRLHGLCGQCGRKIAAGESWTLEHVIALINGGENREKNLGVTCGWCLPVKNAADAAEKSDVYAKRSKHIGARTRRSTFQTSRSGPYKQKIGGEIVRRQSRG